MTRGLMRRLASRTIDQFGLRAQLERNRIRFSAPRYPFSAGVPHFDPIRRLFTFQGSWREIGQQIAAATPPIATVEEISLLNAALPLDHQRQVDLQLDTIVDTVRRYRPEVWELLQGFASNVPSYSDRCVARAVFAPALFTSGPQTSCGCIAASGDSGLIVGQNLDLGITASLALAYILPDDGPACLQHFNAGTLWFGPGVNERGIGFGGGSVNAGLSRKDSAQTAAFPAVLIGSCLWRLASMTDAHAVFTSNSLPHWAPNGDGFSILVYDSTATEDRPGTVCRVEGAADASDVTEIELPAYALNHFANVAMRPLNSTNPSCASLQTNSRERAHSADGFLTAPVTPDSMWRHLRHNRGPGAWCRTARGKDLGWTSASYVFDFAGTKVRSRYGIDWSPDDVVEFDFSFLFERRASS